jgi:GDP-L-fucose synthase
MEHVNVGSGEDLTILELARIVARVVGFDGPIVTDTSKPDGMPRKLMSGDRIAALGWKPTKPFEVGVRETYQWFLSEVTGNMEE